MTEKSAAAILHELAVKAGVLPEYECAQTGPQHLSLFVFHCKAFGLKATGEAPSKKIAKQECAKALLREMSRAGHYVPAPFCLPIAPAPVAKDNGDMKKTGLQGTFVMAREAAEDSARGIKRGSCAVVNEVPKKLNTIAFVKYGEDASLPIDKLKASCSTSATSSKMATTATAGCSKDVAENIVNESNNIINIDYLEELSLVRCVAANCIAEHMFNTKFGKLVLLVRHWQRKLDNIQSSCHLCGLNFDYAFNEMSNACTLKIEGKVVAEACAATLSLGRGAVENAAWKILSNEVISIFVKERFIPQDGAAISFPEAQGSHQPEPREAQFGAPVEASVASRMMRMMGWQGGGLGADAQGIAEPVRPHLQIIHRAGLGSDTAGIHQIQTAAESVIRRYIESDCIDVDLVFHSDFNMEERKVIHIAAKKHRLKSRSYGKNAERFVVVSQKINLFELAHALVQKGGETPKYKIFIPAKIASFYREIE